MTARIDAHCHVWDLEVRDQPWIDGDTMAGLRRSFGITELANTAADSGVGGVVVVQTVADVAETEELLDLAAAEPLIVGVVGWVDLEAPDAAEQLDRLIDRPSGRWLAGVRSLVQDEPDPRWLLRPGVLAGLGEVAARGLTFDLLVRPHQLPAAVGAVTAVPSLRFVLDHLAKPAIASGTWEPWAGCVAELARRAERVGQGVRPGHRGGAAMVHRRTSARTPITPSRRSGPTACCSDRTGRCAPSPPRTATWWTCSTVSSRRPPATSERQWPEATRSPSTPVRHDDRRRGRPNCGSAAVEAALWSRPWSAARNVGSSGRR